VHVAATTGYRPTMQDGYHDGDPQSESVSAPQRDEAPPRRGRSTPIVIAVLLLALFALAAALVVAALNAN
jgi:hypothetical protein